MPVGWGRRRVGFPAVEEGGWGGAWVLGCEVVVEEEELAVVEGDGGGGGAGLMERDMA